MIEAFIDGLLIMFSWPTIFFLIIGSIMGLVFGLLPGLQGSLALATLIPVTFGMDMYQAIPLLIGAWGASEGSATAWRRSKSTERSVRTATARTAAHAG